MSRGQRVFAMLSYEDGPAAMDFLASAFGFAERSRMVDGGILGHGEMQVGEDVIMLATPSPAYESPRSHRGHCAAARTWSEVPYVIDGLLVYVDDLDAHCERARAAGAAILTEPVDDGIGRLYRAEDIEGHRWMFVQAEQAGPTG